MMHITVLLKTDGSIFRVTPFDLCNVNLSM